MFKRETVKNKNQIISEYLTGNCSFPQLEAKYGVKARTIQSWVRVYRKRSNEEIAGQESNEVNKLKKQLEKDKMKIELLEEMLRLSEQHTGLDLRKKFGTKQS